MQEEIVYARGQVRYYRARLDDLWMELETATTWEHINQIANELGEVGVSYKEWKKRLSDLTGDELPATMRS